MKFTVLILSVYAVISSLLIVALFFQVQDLKKSVPANPTGSTNFSKVYDINISNAPKMGPEDAPITIVEISDYECRVCAEASEAVDRLMLEFPGKIQRVFKHLPLSYHSNAVPAATATMAAHVQGHFWEMHSLLMKRKEDLGHDFYLSAAKEIGLDLDRFRNDMAVSNWEDYLRDDVDEALALEVPGTPTYFINGVKVVGIDYHKLRQVLITIDPTLSR